MKNSMRYIVLAIFCSLAACSSKQKVRLPQQSLVIMSYNVENLFDTKDNPLKDDETFLPIAYKQSNSAIRQKCEKIKTDYRREECLNFDWNDETLHTKLERLTDVISQVKDGAGPDILIMPEVESLEVLQQWNKEFLQDKAYQTVALVSGNDQRGINVGLISRLPLLEAPQLIQFPFQNSDKANKDHDPSKTRGMLKVKLSLPDGNPLTVYGVHLPAQGNPPEWRKQAVDYIYKMILQMPQKEMAVLAGDFNITAEEDTANNYFPHLDRQWWVAHRHCEDCGRGTHFYSGSWSFLDSILASPGLSPTGKAQWMIDPNSVWIPHESRYQVTSRGTPARFDSNSPNGISDHWPIAAVIVPRHVIE